MKKSPGAKPDYDPFTQTWRLPLARLLLAVAIAISAYLLYISLSSGAAAGCGPESGCDRVLKSRWAYWFGVPVSAPALMVYLSLMAGTFLLKSRPAAIKRQQVWPAMFVLALMVAGAAGWFLGLMAFAIKALCPFCLVAHSAGLVTALLILLNAPVRPEPELPWQKEKQVYLPPARARQLAVAGGVGLALLVSGQVLHQKQMNVVQTIPPAFGVTNAALLKPPTVTTQKPAAVAITSPPPRVTPSSVAATSSIATAKPPTPPPPLTTTVNGRLVSTHNGLFHFNLDELPVMGNPQATNVILSLFDYTCRHCQVMHGHLQSALQSFSNRLAIISLPMPLDAKCNPLIPRTHRDASNACHYARLGLAVWRADRTRFGQFDDYLFGAQRPPPLTEASNYAANLVGADKLGRALADPWIEARIKTDISIYHTNAIIMRNNGAMPQLVIGSAISVGNLNSPRDLIDLIHKNLFAPQ